VPEFTVEMAVAAMMMAATPSRFQRGCRND
jgi:hypothetical protein